MNSETPEQKEERINRSTETAMHQFARRFRVSWLVIPRNVCITPRYVARYFLAMFAWVAGWYALLILFFAALMMTVIMVFDRRSHGFSSFADPGFMKKIATFILGVFRADALIFASLLLSMPTLTTVAFFHGARYWNRRALHLQANPVNSDTPAPNPTVWPPPPRFG